jgi:hypothetical protein
MIKHKLRRHTLKTDDGIGEWNYVLRISGGSSMGAGYIYAPYIPLITNTTMYNPQNISEDFFIPQRALQTRYANTTVNNNFYNTINTDGDMLLSR